MNQQDIEFLKQKELAKFVQLRKLLATCNQSSIAHLYPLMSGTTQVGIHLSLFNYLVAQQPVTFEWTTSGLQTFNPRQIP